MKKYILTTLMAMTVLACGGEEETAGKADNNGTEITQPNLNSNTNLIKNHQVEYATEKTSTDVQQAAMRLEMPRLRGERQDLFIVHTVDMFGVNYSLEYDCALRSARWIAYQWYKGFASHAEEKNDPNYWSRSDWKQTEWRGDPWQVDPLIPRDYQVSEPDHNSDGYDKGHMLGSADRLNSRDANEQTFYYSNIHPQGANINQRGIWYVLEDRLRDVYDQDNFRDTLYVVKGGTIGEGQYTLSKHKLPVPKHFFMAVLCHKKSDTTQNGYKAIGFWMPHEDGTWNKDKQNFMLYAVSIDQLEENTGIDFFCNLPDETEKQVESNLVPAAWGLK